MKLVVKEWRKYRKAIVALAGVVLTGANVLYQNDPRVQALVAIATFLGVYGIRNEA